MSQNNPPAAVSLRDLSKRFGDNRAVDAVSLEIPAGTFYGLVGPNGAGKSTTLAMIAGLLSPDSGAITITGIDPSQDREAALEQLGIMMEGLSLPERLTGPELLEFTARLRQLDDRWQQRADDLLEVLELEPAASTLIVDYSTGMRKKIGLAVALLHLPEILVLDEPFEAIDPISARAIENLLEQYVRGGGTVLLSSHVMDVIERNCQFVAVMIDGSIALSGAVEDVVGRKSLNDTFIDLVGASELRPISWLS